MTQTLSRPSVDPATAEPSRSTSKIIDDWIREQIKDSDQISIPEVADKAVERFLDDRVFIRSFLTDMLRPMIYWRAKKVVAATRGLTLAGDQILDLGSVEERSKQIAHKFVNWVEHSGERSVRLMRMTRNDLQLAAQERRKRGIQELHLSDLWTELAKRLEADQVVEDVWSPEEIESVSARIEQERQARIDAAMKKGRNGAANGNL